MAHRLWGRRKWGGKEGGQGLGNGTHVLLLLRSTVPGSGLRLMPQRMAGDGISGHLDVRRPNKQFDYIFPKTLNSNQILNLIIIIAV